ncbi:MAG: ribonuclease HII [Anaerolineales bacterium]
MRTNPDLSFERRLWKSGLRFLAGLDEAGRGALAGPVAVGAVVLPNDPSVLLGGRGERERAEARTTIHRTTTLVGVRDSKQMTPEEREEAAPKIKALALAWGVGLASAEEIDAEGIVTATRLAALRAVEQLGLFPDYLLTDFRLELPELDIPQTALVRGDGKCLSIAAASVLAKTTRDALMREIDIDVPGYGLSRHKGYGTPAHLLALRSMGQSAVHRKSFTIKGEMMEATETRGRGEKTA